MKLSYLVAALSVVLCSSVHAQNPTADDSAEAKAKAAVQAKANAEVMAKARAQDPHYYDEDDDGDGLGDVDGDGVGDLAAKEAHEATHTVQQGKGQDATERKRPGRTKYGDITLKKGYAADDSSNSGNEEKPKKSSKKKDNDH